MVDLWAPWCGPCRTLRHHREGRRRDGGKAYSSRSTSTRTRSRGDFGVQSIPAVYALCGPARRRLRRGLPGAHRARVRAALLPSEEQTRLAELIAKPATSRRCGRPSSSIPATSRRGRPGRADGGKQGRRGAAAARPDPRTPRCAGSRLARVGPEPRITTTSGSRRCRQGQGRRGRRASSTSTSSS